MEKPRHLLGLALVAALLAFAQPVLAQSGGAAVGAPQLSFTGTIPTITGTGTPAITSGSTDTAGEVTGGTLAVSIVVTFATAKTNAPFCIVTPQTQVAAFAYGVSTTAITVTLTATTGEKIDYVCVQH